ncbi:MAG: hypothetical protein UY16_C0003G0039 [Candidatus Gottesmanbacteria bacterium GW2011_GWA2_47_9]|uniref:Uncharacterized protein n=1 Tax=Candidatus Gottesmanbacteria bacterium GW2011_GWA2_47_9 TaxID=1618445 RepID=A0A0G1U3P8_9BACT|nr:MAG: hypothetical protein UY16_C0003G0039 [Candidatus Gottesmanbacteria bacterium GW2011_GWA2_47_9]
MGGESHHWRGAFCFPPKKGCMNFLKLHFIKITLGVALLSVSSASGMYIVKQIRTAEQTQESLQDVAGATTESVVTVTPSLPPKATPTPNTSLTPAVIYKEPSPVSTSVPTQAPITTQVTAVDSATHIELCKTKAETFKTQTMTALVLVYNQNNADAIKIANTSSVEELVNVGISIGLVTSEQYNSDPSGHQLALLKTREKVMAEIKSFMDTVNGKGGLAYNDYYARCLNNEN